MPVTITRSILVVIIPGLLAAAPWALWLASKIEISGDVYKTYSALINASLFGLSVILGAIIEGGVSHLEVRWDKQRETDLGVTKNWYDYLAQQFASEPVGFRYLSRLATTFYFELSMMVASPIALVGVAVLIFDKVESLWSRAGFVIILLAVVIVPFFFWQAKCTHRVLCETRKEINARLQQSR